MILHVKSLSLTRTQTSSPGISFLSAIPLCATRTPPLTQRCLVLLRYEKLRLFLLNISFSHTNTNSVSQGLIFSIVLLYVAHTHPLSLEISCVPSYVSLAITLIVKYLSLSQTQNSVSLDLISLWYLFVCDSHAPSLYLSHTHTHNPAFWSTRLLSLAHTS